MLEINNLSKRYKKTKTPALNNVGFSVKKGEFTALLGANGAGKTTLLNIITGIVKEDSGSVLLEGKNLLRGNKYLKSKIGIVPQELVFDYIFTVEETLKLYSGYYGIIDNRDHIEYLLDRLSLTDKRDIVVRSLSGGMKRRLLVARALVHRPEILLLDEPTAGVDISLRKEMYDFLNELHDDGMTIILTTHYLEEAEKLCSRILMLKQGNLIADRSKEDFLSLAGDRVDVRIDFHSTPDEKLTPKNLVYTNNEKTEGILSDSRSRLPEILENISLLRKDVRDIQIQQPNIEDVFLRLSDSEEERQWMR